MRVRHPVGNVTKKKEESVIDVMQEYYLWMKSLHLFAVISWGAGLFYLPRLFVYHAPVPVGSERDIMLQTMERRLLKIIMNPSMILVLVTGMLLLMTPGAVDLKEGWVHFKLLLVFCLFGYHGMCVKFVRLFLNGQNTRTHKFYRLFNEIPPLVFLVIVVLVIVKPF